MDLESFLTILHEWLLGAAVAWSAGRVSKRAGFKVEGRGFESSLKNFFALFFLPDLEVFSRVFRGRKGREIAHEGLEGIRKHYCEHSLD